MHLLLFSENSKLEGDWRNKILTTQKLVTNFEHFEPDCHDFDSLFKESVCNFYKFLHLLNSFWQKIGFRFLE